MQFVLWQFQDSTSGVDKHGFDDFMRAYNTHKRLERTTGRRRAVPWATGTTGRQVTPCPGPQVTARPQHVSWFDKDAPPSTPGDREASLRTLDDGDAAPCTLDDGDISPCSPGNGEASSRSSVDGDTLCRRPRVTGRSLLDPRVTGRPCPAPLATERLAPMYPGGLGGVVPHPR